MAKLKKEDLPPIVMKKSNPKCLFMSKAEFVELSKREVEAEKAAEEARKKVMESANLTKKPKEVLEIENRIESKTQEIKVIKRELTEAVKKADKDPDNLSKQNEVSKLNMRLDSAESDFEKLNEQLMVLNK